MFVTALKSKRKKKVTAITRLKIHERLLVLWRGQTAQREEIGFFVNHNADD